MAKTTTDAIEQQLLGPMRKTGTKVRELTFFFHPEQPTVVVEFNGGDVEVNVPEFKFVPGSANKGWYAAFKKYVPSALKTLNAKNAFEAIAETLPLPVFIQHVDEEPKLLFQVGAQKGKRAVSEEGLFEGAEGPFSFDLSMLDAASAKKKWWLVVPPLGQFDAERLGHTLFNMDKRVPSWMGDSLAGDPLVKKRTLASHKKIGRLFDYAMGADHEVLSSRFCALLAAIPVGNLEVYPLNTVCKGTKASSAHYYKLVNIVGTTDAVRFYDEDSGELCDEGDIRSLPLGNRQALEKLPEKMVRCRDAANDRYSMLYIVDDDVKKACVANHITGIQFKEVPLVAAKEFAKEQITPPELIPNPLMAALRGTLQDFQRALAKYPNEINRVHPVDAELPTPIFWALRYAARERDGLEKFTALVKAGADLHGTNGHGTGLRVYAESYVRTFNSPGSRAVLKLLDAAGVA